MRPVQRSHAALSICSLSSSDMASAANRALALFRSRWSDAKTASTRKAANKAVLLLKQHRPPFRANRGGAVTTAASFAPFGVGSGGGCQPGAEGKAGGQKGRPATDSEVGSLVR